MVMCAEGNTIDGVITRVVMGPARSENQGMHRVFMRENREVPYSPAGLITGRAVQGTLRRKA